jgi:hypothetical protein
MLMIPQILLHKLYKLMCNLYIYLLGVEIAPITLNVTLVCKYFIITFVLTLTFSINKCLNRL